MPCRGEFRAPAGVPTRRPRISVDGRPRNRGLGTWAHVSFAEARQKCILNLLARQRGELGHRRRQSVPTFAEALAPVMALHSVRGTAVVTSDPEPREKVRSSRRKSGPYNAAFGGVAGSPDPGPEIHRERSTLAPERTGILLTGTQVTTCNKGLP